MNLLLTLKKKYLEYLKRKLSNYPSILVTARIGRLDTEYEERRKERASIRRAADEEINMLNERLSQQKDLSSKEIRNINSRLRKLHKIIKDNPTTLESASLSCRPYQQYGPTYRKKRTLFNKIDKLQIELGSE